MSMASTWKESLGLYRNFWNPWNLWYSQGSLEFDQHPKKWLLFRASRVSILFHIMISNSVASERWFAPLWIYLEEEKNCPWDKVSFHLWSISALANSPADHFSGRQRYHQCPDLDQTFSKGWGTSLLKLSKKSTFSARRKDKTYKC